MRSLLPLGLVLALAVSAGATTPIERDPLVPQRTVVVTTSIVVLDAIRFRPGSARLEPKSLPMLEAIAETLRAFDEMRLEISGPRRRVVAVRDVLVDKGVAPERLRVRAIYTRSRSSAGASSGIEFHVLAP